MCRRIVENFSDDTGARIARDIALDEGTAAMTRPESERLTARRVKAALAALEAACKARGEYPLHGDESVAALLCDLRGFCADAGMDFEHCNELGLVRFEQEREGDTAF